MKSHVQVKALLLVLLLVLEIGGLAWSSLTELPTRSGLSSRLDCPRGARCFTPSSLNGQTVWQASGLPAESFTDAFLIAPPDVRGLVAHYGGGYRSAEGEAAAQIQSNPAVFVYLPGSAPLGASDAWPVDFRKTELMLRQVDSFVAVGTVSGQPRLLLAARNKANLQRLVECALGGVCPEVSRASVTRWKSVGGDRPEWAEMAFTVDLRQPDRSTAVVYAVGRQAGTLLGGGSDWSARPSNLRAVFRPDNGRRSAELPDFRTALTLDQTGRLVYEVTPLFSPGASARSRVFDGGAYIRMGTLLPDLRALGSKKVAVRWLLPDGWSVNAPWEKVGDWYAAEAPDVLNEYIGVGPFSYHTFSAGQTTFTIGIMSSVDPAERARWNEVMEKGVRYLVDRFGDPPVTRQRDFRLTVFHAGLTDGGSAGNRTATTTASKRVALHEMIHWWVGIRSQDQIPSWHESMTEYLASRVMMDIGAEVQTDPASIGGVSYERLTQAKDPYRGTAVAFQRDLDLLIRDQSEGRFSLFDVVRYFHATPGYQHGMALSKAELIRLIRAATGVDPITYFAVRY